MRGTKQRVSPHSIIDVCIYRCDVCDKLGDVVLAIRGIFAPLINELQVKVVLLLTKHSYFATLPLVSRPFWNSAIDSKH